jgi:hypothetical protein
MNTQPIEAGLVVRDATDVNECHHQCLIAALPAARNTLEKRTNTDTRQSVGVQARPQPRISW